MKEDAIGFKLIAFFLKKNEKHVQFFSVFVYIGVRERSSYKEQSLGNYPVTTRLLVMGDKARGERLKARGERRGNAAELLTLPINYKP